MTALARRLEERGHKVVIFGIADSAAIVRAAGIEFVQIGAEDYPPGTLRALDQRLSELKGLATFRFTVERVKNTTKMVLRDGPRAVCEAGCDALLVDEADMGGNVAEHLGLPFVSLAFFPPLMQTDRIPPFCFGWKAGPDVFSRVRNNLGLRLLSRVAWPIFAVVNRQRVAWGLKPLKRSTDGISTLAQITQLPRGLEFAAAPQPQNLHYTGPWVDARQRPAIEFPWERLDARPLVYASLGTLQNGAETPFRRIAEACDQINVQLVLSLGGGMDPERLGQLPGDPVVVRYAPQLDLIKRAAAVITHAGLNTVLETLAEGVPMVALPQGNDQPGVAARVAASGAGVVLTRRKATVPAVRAALRRVLEDGQYREAARRLQAEMNAVDGLARAAELIEDALRMASSPCTSTSVDCGLEQRMRARETD
jgi:UDP:flavonoid glycosyltransferase YjiC (YdhE family)